MSGEARKHRIAAAFDGADDYDSHAHVQREVACHLAERIERCTLPRVPTILEVGCGTGYLSQELASLFPVSRLVCSDVSARMLARAQRRMGKGSAEFRVMDGEHPELEFSADLIASSLVFQWFENLETAISRLASLLGPGGILAFAIPTSGTFREWRQAHQELGLPAGAHRFPEVRWFETCLPTAWKVAVDYEDLRMEYGNARSFLKSIRGVGATVPADGYQGLRPHEMRRLLAHCDTRPGFAVTWEIAYVFAFAPRG